MNSMASIMTARDVTYRYAGTSSEALKGLQLSIPQGARTAICGHNGSGKSTFFLHAVGIHRPEAGTISWKGNELSYRSQDLKRLRQQVGLVFQDPEQQLILSTPYEDVSYGLRNAGIDEQEIRLRTDSMLASMGLSHLAHTPIHHLSLGLKKRVALAGVLVLNPELLLLDEPTAYLDRQSEQRLMEELDRIHDNGVTVVMATHDMNLAYAWADWILILDQGVGVMAGTPQEVFREADKITALGLELPLLLEVWQSLPESIRLGAAPPRNLTSLKRHMKEIATT